MRPSQSSYLNRYQKRTTTALRNHIAIPESVIRESQRTNLQDSFLLSSSKRTQSRKRNKKSRHKSRKGSIRRRSSAGKENHNHTEDSENRFDNTDRLYLDPKEQLRNLRIDHVLAEDDPDEANENDSSMDSEKQIVHSVNSIDTFSASREDSEVLKGLDAVRQRFLTDKKNHFIKCQLLTLAEIRSKKGIKKKNNLLSYQEAYFKKRGVRPTIDDIVSLSNTLKIFGNRVHKLYDLMQRKKVLFFLRWKIKVFGYNYELMKQVNRHFEKTFQLSYKKAKRRKNDQKHKKIKKNSKQLNNFQNF